MDITKAKETFKQYGGTTPEFSLNNLKTWARVVSIYDADTMTVVIPVFDKYFKFNVRLMGIDTCEMKSKNEKCKEYALKARNRVYELVTNKVGDITWKRKQMDQNLDSDVYLVWLHCLEFDKFGRVLGDVFLSDTSTKSISSSLLQDKLAYPYQGDTKLTEEEQIRYLTSP